MEHDRIAPLKILLTQSRFSPGSDPWRWQTGEIFPPILWDYQTETSELTFTNLFIWQSHYGYRWSRDRDRLLVVGAVPGGEAWALPPVGPPPRVDLLPADFGLAQRRVRGGEPGHRAGRPPAGGGSCRASRLRGGACAGSLRLRLPQRRSDQSCRGANTTPSATTSTV